MSGQTNFDSIDWQHTEITVLRNRIKEQDREIERLSDVVVELHAMVDLANEVITSGDASEIRQLLAAKRSALKC